MGFSRTRAIAHRSVAKRNPNPPEDLRIRSQAIIDPIGVKEISLQIELPKPPGHVKQLVQAVGDHNPHLIVLKSVFLPLRPKIKARVRYRRGRQYELAIVV